MQFLTHRNVLIEKSYNGFYVALLKNLGTFGKSDTLKGIKRLIDNDLKKDK